MNEIDAFDAMNALMMYGWRIEDALINAIMNALIIH